MPLFSVAPGRTTATVLRPGLDSLPDLIRHTEHDESIRWPRTVGAQYNGRYSPTKFTFDRPK